MKNMNIIVSIIIYLTFIFSINFDLAEGKKLSENYVLFDKRSPRNARIRSSEDTQINPSLENAPFKIVSLVEPGDNKLLERENSTSSDSIVTSPEDSTPSTNNSTGKDITSTIPFSGQSSPEINQPTIESTTKETITTDQNPSGNVTSANDYKNITSKSPVPSDATSSTPPFKPRFVDATTFKGGMNHWDFEGEWAKYDLRSLRAEIKPVPELQITEDNVVFMTKMVAPVFLRKEFPPLTNATITMTFYLKTSNEGSMEMKGFVSNSDGEKMIFDLSKREIFEHNYLWCTNKFILGSYQTPFSVIIRLSSSARSLWAANAITVRGWQTSEKKEMSGYPEFSTSRPTQPSSMFTTPDKTSTHNTTETNDSYSTNSTESSRKYDELNDNDNSASTESRKDLAHIATAIWDAFYVFLALFCACLLALIILIVKQRCRDDPMPPAMATYSPRVSSYQVGKPRDNPSYETDSV